MCGMSNAVSRDSAPHAPCQRPTPPHIMSTVDRRCFADENGGSRAAAHVACRHSLQVFASGHPRASSAAALPCQTEDYNFRRIVMGGHLGQPLSRVVCMARNRTIIWPCNGYRRSSIG